MLSAGGGAAIDAISLRFCGAAEVLLVAVTLRGGHYGRGTLIVLPACAGLLTTTLGIVLAFFPAQADYFVVDV